MADESDFDVVLPGDELVVLVQTTSSGSAPVNRRVLLREAALRPGIWVTPVEDGFGYERNWLMQQQGFEVGSPGRIRYVGSERLAELRAQADEKGTWTRLPFTWLRARDIRAGLFGFDVGKYDVHNGITGVLVRVRVREDETK